MDMAKMCRVCLLSEDIVHLLDWHQPIDSLECLLSYKECFCKCTQINLSLKDDPSDVEDTRTQYLCFCCAQKLKDAHEFIEKAKKADIELRSRQIDKNFEWVAVSAKGVEIEKKEGPIVDDKNCLDEINVTNLLWQKKGRKEKGTNIYNIDEEDITIANLKKELEEHSLVEKRKPISKAKHISKDQTLKSVTKSEDCEEFIGEDEVISPRGSDQDTFSDKKVKITAKKKEESKEKIKKPRKCRINMDEIMTCEVCQKVMKRKTLIKHKQRHRPKTFLCKACPKTFSDSNALKNHEVIHEENRERFSCDKCDQTFLSRFTFKRHAQTHEINRIPKYQCTQCPKSFLQKTGLMTHILHHEGPKWKCSLCEKRYVRRIDLDVHMRTHSGEAPFRCKLCARTFIHKRILNRHMQHHEGFYRYTCITCGEHFAKYDKYYSHRQQHFGLAYKCGVCEKAFPDSYKVKRHIKGVHKIMDDEEVKKVALKVNETKEHRGRIIEVLRNPDDPELI
ncbi:zinc finger protein 69-like [Eurosta solidaginis]|uniref:zinc finger protein 69-like n=1 Tax=Eurosta solidaginis TaxID=178769 RepID=UPI00353117AB